MLDVFSQYAMSRTSVGYKKEFPQTLKQFNHLIKEHRFNFILMLPRPKESYVVLYYFLLRKFSYLLSINIFNHANSDFEHFYYSILLVLKILKNLGNFD